MKQGKEIVDSPQHYHPRVPKQEIEAIIDRINKRGYIEVIDVIQAWNLNFSLGSSAKYILRCGEKDDEVTELKKAIKYLEFEIEQREANKNG